MFLIIFFITKWLLTLLALKLLLTVSLQVGIQSVLSEKSRITDFTCVLLLWTMLFLMVCQMTLCGKRPTTTFSFAAERLFSGMDTHMSLKVAIFSEWLVTNFTFKRFFSRVGSLMDFETSRSWICFTTLITNERFLTCMDKCMRLEMTFGYETLSTALKVTLEGSVTCMGSHVSLQVACFIEKLHALRKAAKQDLVGSTLPPENFVECLAKWDRIMV